MSTRRRLLLGFLFAGLAVSPRLAAHESPVDPMPRVIWIWVDNDRLHLQYEIQLSERAALLELHTMDHNRDGIIQENERHTYFAARAQELAGRWQIRLGDVALTLEAVGPVTCSRGWRQTFAFQAALPPPTAGAQKLRLRDDNARLRPGPFQWSLGRPPDLVAREPAAPTSPVRLRALPSRATPPADNSLLELELAF